MTASASLFLRRHKEPQFSIFRALKPAGTKSMVFAVWRGCLNRHDRGWLLPQAGSSLCPDHNAQSDCDLEEKDKVLVILRRGKEFPDKPSAAVFRNPGQSIRRGWFPPSPASHGVLRVEIESGLTAGETLTRPTPPLRRHGLCW
jgi:hypothetical protein